MKKLLLALVICVSFFLISSGSLFAEVTIYGIEIPGLHQQDKQGVYDLILEETVIGAKLATLKIEPPARAENNFEKCDNCCFSPANKNPEFYEFGDDIISTDPMNTAKIYIFVKKGQAPISNLQDLKGQNIGLRLGMHYGKSFDNTKLKTENVDKLSANIQKLSSGRIDAIIAYIPDMYQAFRDLGINPLPHEVSKPVAIHPDCIVCRGVDPQFIAKFNSMLKKLKANGRQKEILGENFISE